MSLKTSVKLILLAAIVATNILSLYHLSYTTNFFKPKKPTSPQHIPDNLLHQLHTLRATITQLTRLHAPQLPSDLVSLSRVSPVPTSCNAYPELLYRYMNYTPFVSCPKDDASVAESLMLRGCHPLPRRRCFARTPEKCGSFECLGISLDVGKHEFSVYRSNLDLTIPQLFDIAKKSGSVLRLGVDIGGESGSFAVKMREKNVTVLTTTMNLGVPYSEVNAMRGVVAIHAPLQQRLSVFDGVVDLVRCGHAVNRWIPVTMLEFLMYDVDRLLRGGGFLWVDHFFSKRVDFKTVYRPLFFRLGYKIVKWATRDKVGSKGVKNGELYLTALLQKPKSK